MMATDPGWLPQRFASIPMAHGTARLVVPGRLTAHDVRALHALVDYLASWEIPHLDGVLAGAEIGEGPDDD